MNHGCPDPEELLAAHDAGDDAVLDHLAGCAKCRSLVAARDCFLRGDDATVRDPDETARLADADARLAAVITDATGTSDTDTRSADGASASVQRLAWKPAYAWPAALAAVLVAATGIWLVTSGPGSGTPGGGIAPQDQVWRGADEGRLPTPAPRATALPHGGLHLAWQPVAGADRYTVELLDEDLTTMADLDAGAATELDLPEASVPDEARGGFFVVTAYAGNRQLGRWSPVRLP